MNKSNISKKNSETQHDLREIEILEAIVSAYQRTGHELPDEPRLERAVNDISEEFLKLSTEQITKAIRNGSLGAYGQTYRLNTQEICIWLRKYIDDMPYTERMIFEGKMKPNNNLQTDSEV